MPECEFRFASKQKLEEHALVAHSLDIKVELAEGWREVVFQVDKTCHMCKQEIRSLSDFRTHILRDHRYIHVLKLHLHLHQVCLSFPGLRSEVCLQTETRGAHYSRA